MIMITDFSVYWSKIAGSQWIMLTPHRHLISFNGIFRSQCGPNVLFAFFVGVMRLFNVCYLCFLLHIRFMRFIAVRYLHLYILYKSYGIYHCFLSSLVIFTFTFYIGFIILITVCYLHLYILYRSYEIDHRLLFPPYILYRSYEIGQCLLSSLLLAAIS
jgi:hypothetical protein